MGRCRDGATRRQDDEETRCEKEALRQFISENFSMPQSKEEPRFSILQISIRHLSELLRLTV
jgi:hypothetical protein